MTFGLFSTRRERESLPLLICFSFLSAHAALADFAPAGV